MIRLAPSIRGPRIFCELRKFKISVIVPQHSPPGWGAPELLAGGKSCRAVVKMETAARFDGLADRPPRVAPIVAAARKPNPAIVRQRLPTHTTHSAARVRLRSSGNGSLRFMPVHELILAALRGLSTCRVWPRITACGVAGLFVLARVS
jgi:hypothetical protein